MLEVFGVYTRKQKNNVLHKQVYKYDVKQYHTSKQLLSKNCKYFKVTLFSFYDNYSRGDITDGDNDWPSFPRHIISNVIFHKVYGPLADTL